MERRFYGRFAALHKFTLQLDWPCSEHWESGCKVTAKELHMIALQVMESLKYWRQPIILLFGIFVLFIVKL
jgi:hypothetical protein